MELTELSAWQAAELIRSRAVSPSELLQAYLARIEKLDPRYNAWVGIDRERALDDAIASREHIARGPQHHILAGVPIGVKDVLDVRGFATLAGVEFTKRVIAHHDAHVVSSLRQAGAVVLGKLVTTQLAYRDPSPTRNPWCRSRTPGGSSSGPAVAVATRMLPLAIATQTGGSTLRPAAYNGVVGFKPSQRLLATAGIMPLAPSLDQIGVIVRCVRDCELFLDATAQRGSGNVRERRASTSGKSIRQFDVAIARETFELCEDVERQHLDGSLTALEAAGVHISDLDATLRIGRLHALHRTILAREAARMHGHIIDEVDLQPNIRALIMSGRTISESAYRSALLARTRERIRIERELRRYDALLAPAVVGPAPSVNDTGSSAALAPFSLLGFPSIAIPTGLDVDGLPQSLQLVGARNTDRLLLRFGQFLEDIFDFTPSPV